MLLITWVEKREEAYLSAVDEAWQQEILPRVARWAIPHPSAASVVAPGAPAAPATAAPLADELSTLSLQVRALQETVADLHEGLSRAAQMRQG
jgi:hypothetical protein